jgi:hypothetical protein
MKLLNALWVKTKKIASLYTGTFIFVMFLNQLLFFGLCLNPICLIAAMPHVLFITVVLGTLITKLENRKVVEKQTLKKDAEACEPISVKSENHNDSDTTSFLDGMVEFAISCDENAKKLENKTEAFLHKARRERNTKRLNDLKKRVNDSRAKVSKTASLNSEVSAEFKPENASSDLVFMKDSYEAFGAELNLPFSKKAHKTSSVKVEGVSWKYLDVLQTNKCKVQSLTFSPRDYSGDLLWAKKDQEKLTPLERKANYDFKSNKNKVYVEPLSTTMLCKANGINNRPDFFRYLIECGLIIFKNNKYHLTDKGKQFGGKYKENNKNERWVVWSNSQLRGVINNFKRPALKNLKINALMHITHIGNLSSILSLGLLPHNNKAQKVDISNGLVNARRVKKEPIHKHSIHDYVPFYFNARNAMLYQVQKEFGAEIIILLFRKDTLLSPKVIFSNGNAASKKAIFTSDLKELEAFNWNAIFSSNWSQNVISELDLKSQMMSECLVYEKVPINKLHCIYYQNLELQQRILKICEDKQLDIRVIVDPMLFF